MRTLSRWTVEVFVGEDDGRPTPRPRCTTTSAITSRHRRGPGQPGDADVPEIGDEIAVARALLDLGIACWASPRRTSSRSPTNRPSSPGRSQLCSGTIVMAPHGHSAAQMPHPLQ